MLILVCVCTCVHVHSRASFSLSPCVCARVCARVCVPVSSSASSSSSSFLTLISQKAALLTVRRLAGRPSAFYFDHDFFNEENTLARRATPESCVKTNRVLFNDESGALPYICRSACVRVFSSFPLDRAVARSTAKSPKHRRAGGTSGSSRVCIYFSFLRQVAARHICISVQSFTQAPA